jgi:hypothetical protein
LVTNAVQNFSRFADDVYQTIANTPGWLDNKDALATIGTPTTAPTAYLQEFQQYQRQYQQFQQMQDQIQQLQDHLLSSWDGLSPSRNPLPRYTSIT